jgi:hypothetical protein
MYKRLMLLAAACSLATGAHAADPAAPQPFSAIYDLEWRGVGAGSSTLDLVRLGGNEYTFRSSNVARGFFRFAFPNPITQTTRFVVEDGVVRPMAYRADDGSSKTDRDIDLKFDWKSMRATGTTENKPVDAELRPGTQDGLSVQISLMVALAAGQSPDHFLLFDKTETKDYRYTREGNATLDTPAGKLETVVFRSDREGSSRVTRMWLTPSLGYLPAQAEQLRNGRREFMLRLRSVSRH